MRKRLFRTSFILLFLPLFLFAKGRKPSIFYVDATRGRDEADGMTPQSAWQTLSKVNRATILPGDQVLFKRGEIWRGQLLPHSGSREARIVYGAYGKGAKPILQQSYARDRAEDWEEAGPGLWATRRIAPKQICQIYDCEDSRWHATFQEGAEGLVKRAVENGFWYNRIICKRAGKARHEIQLWGPGLKDLPPAVILKMKVRSTLPFPLSSMELMMNHPPWTQSMKGIRSQNGGRKIGNEWETISFLFTKTGEIDLPYLHFSIGDVLPEGAIFDFSPLEIWKIDEGYRQNLTHDIGILIFNHGEKFGVKKWRAEDLISPFDYWYDADGRRVVVKSDQNPARMFSSIELAQTIHIVNQSGQHDIVYDGLMLRYTGAHGFGGSATKNITIRNCDLCWIGGGLQFFHKNGKPVRFGNAIEFWNAAEGHLIERNRIWEVYDAALTNQGRGKDSIQRNIIYRNNIIWNAEYSFEYWNNPEGAITENIVFENNTCINSGFGWAHAQRPDQNGAHLMFYNNSAQTSGVVVQNNIFVGTTEYSTRMCNDWRSGLQMRNNLYFMDKPILWWRNRTRYTELGKYQGELGMDAGSVFARPEFVDPERHDYRLKPGTVGTRLATDGGSVGARIVP